MIGYGFKPVFYICGVKPTQTVFKNLYIALVWSSLRLGESMGII